MSTRRPANWPQATICAISGHEDDLEFTGTGVDGRIAVTDDAVDIDVKLGFALAMLESQIRSSIETAIDERLDA